MINSFIVERVFQSRPEFETATFQCQAKAVRNMISIIISGIKITTLCSSCLILMAAGNNTPAGKVLANFRGNSDQKQTRDKGLFRLSFVYFFCFLLFFFPKYRICWYRHDPVGPWCQNDVITTPFYVMCPLGI